MPENSCRARIFWKSQAPGRLALRPGSSSCVCGFTAVPCSACSSSQRQVPEAGLGTSPWRGPRVVQDRPLLVPGACSVGPACSSGHRGPLKSALALSTLFSSDPLPVKCNKFTCLRGPRRGASKTPWPASDKHCEGGLSLL